MCFNLNRIQPAITLLRSITALSRTQYQNHFPTLDKYQLYCSKRLCTSEAGDSTMNAPKLPWAKFNPCFEFTDAQKQLCLGDPNIADIIAEKTARKEFFYGIETRALSKRLTACLDFNMFLPQVPDFISIVWTRRFSEALEVTTMRNLPNIQMIPILTPHIPAMPHLTVHRVTQKDLNDFCDLNLSNVLVLRGDHFAEGQEYNYAYEAVKYLRCVRGKSLAIAVAGYPEGYTNLQVGPRDKAVDIEYLKMKIDAGANLIITQLCYSGEKIVQFVRDARSAGITAPILVGSVVPHSFCNYLNIERLTGVSLSPEGRGEMVQLSNDDSKVKDYFVQLMVRNIEHVLNAGLGIYGFQFFTLNHFEPIVEVLRKLCSRGIPK
ncbi:hypothetical protein KR093_008792 [Drosophila rubida]|uniref:Methylenetetrahydrofolate reductase (NAD(P)H) n=1 Tax=Drosophila rubida TaxID=30044 RepID=A0AAD4PL46_9MUSC|nr:hypothetical protein KR093_008792 [Drosophila rubida]